MEPAIIPSKREFDERVRMKSPQIQVNENAGNNGATNGSARLPIEWSEGERFCLKMRKGVSLQPKNQKERHHYVKLVIDLPDYRADRSPVWVRGDRRHGGVDCPNLVRGLPRLVSRIAHFWAQKWNVKAC